MRLLSVSRLTTSLLTDCPDLLGATMPPALPCCTRCCRSIVLKYVGTLMCIASTTNHFLSSITFHRRPISTLLLLDDNVCFCRTDRTYRLWGHHAPRTSMLYQML